MKKFYSVLIVLAAALFLLSACAPTIQTVEVTRVITQIVQVNVTSTPVPSLPPSPTPTPTLTPTLMPSPTLWPTSHFETPIPRLTMTPGIEVVSNDTRPDVEKFVSQQYIKDYLALQIGIKSHGGKVFCDYEPMGVGNNGLQIQLYLWIACSEYYWNDQGLTMGSAMSIPVVLYIEWRGLYQIVDYRVGMNDPAIKENFPPEVQNIILFAHSKAPAILVNGISALDQEVEKEAKAYFGNP